MGTRRGNRCTGFPVARTERACSAGRATGAPMTVRLGVWVKAVTSQLWNRSFMDCRRRMFTSSTILGEMSTPIHRPPRFSAETHAVAQPQAEECQPKGAGSEKSPALLPNESARPASSRESRRRQALYLPWPTFVRSWRDGSAWTGGLRFGRRGYSEHRMLLVAGLSLHCTAPRQLRIPPLLTRGIASQHSVRTTGFQPFPPLTVAPRWRVGWLGSSSFPGCWSGPP